MNVLSDYYTRENSAEIITLSTVKRYLRINLAIAEEDSFLTSLIFTTTEWGERYTNRIFKQVNFEGFFQELSTTQYDQNFLQIRRSPLNTVTSVEIKTDSGYVPYTDYKLKFLSSFSRLLFTESITYEKNEPYPIKVNFSAGYENTPEQLKTAILSHIAFLYENRGDTEPEGKLKIPLEIRALYRPFKIMNSYG